MGPITILYDTYYAQLYDYAKNLFTAFEIFMYSETEKTLTYNTDIDSRRIELLTRRMVMPSWLSFCTGVECLLKAVLLKHEVLKITKKEVVNKRKVLHTNATNCNDACRVYDFVDNLFIRVENWPWFKKELQRKRIERVYELNLGTIGSCIEALPCLEKRGTITGNELESLENALRLFADVRRNSYTHTIYGITAVASINNDLDGVYLPMVNLLFQIYSR